MDIVTSKQCEKCLSWKVPHFSETTTLGEPRKWAVIWYCPDDRCHEYSTPPNNPQQRLF